MSNIGIMEGLNSHCYAIEAKFENFFTYISLLELDYVTKSGMTFINLFQDQEVLILKQENFN